MTHRLSTADFKIPVLLIGLSLIPAAGGVVRLVSVAHDTAITPDNARFVQAPTPVVLHALGALTYSLLGAFQFERRFRLRWPRWHRRAGRLLALAGLVTGVSGLWMTVSYAIPPGMQGPILYAVRLLVGTAMIASILIGWQSILKKQVARHEAFMIRAYALGQGAATQALVLLPWMLSTGESTGLTRDLLMTLAWVINVVVAERIIHRRAHAAAHGGLACKAAARAVQTRSPLATSSTHPHGSCGR